MVRYRFNAMSRALTSVRIPLAKYSNSVESVFLVGSNSDSSSKKLKRAVRQTNNNNNKGTYFTYYKHIPTGTVKLMGLLPHQLAQDLLLVAVKRKDYQNVLVTQFALHSFDTTRIIQCTENAHSLLRHCFFAGSYDIFSTCLLQVIQRTI